MNTGNTSNAMDDWKKAAAKLEEQRGEQRKAKAERHSDAAYLRQAVAHADEILVAAIEHVNARCGAGTTPELVGAFMQAAAAVMAANIIARSTEWSGTTVSTSIDNAAMG
jgi:hypothetical protein